MAFGQGRTDLESKAAALLYAWQWECGLDHLSEFLDSIVSITTDLGVESGLAEYETLDIEQLLPWWLLASRMVLDVDGPGPMMVELARKHLFMHALPIAGTLRIFSNASKQTNKALAWWPEFYKSSS